MDKFLKVSTTLKYFLAVNIFFGSLSLSQNTISIVDSVGSVGDFTSIYVPVDNLPIISYSYNYNESLKVLKCGNTSCTFGNIVSTVDTVGSYSSIKVPLDNLPLISYWDCNPPILSGLNK